MLKIIDESVCCCRILRECWDSVHEFSEYPHNPEKFPGSESAMFVHPRYSNVSQSTLLPCHETVQLKPSERPLTSCRCHAKRRRRYDIDLRFSMNFYAIHSFIHSSIHSFIHSFRHSFIHSFIFIDGCLVWKALNGYSTCPVYWRRHCVWWMQSIRRLDRFSFTVLMVGIGPLNLWLSLNSC